VRAQVLFVVVCLGTVGGCAETGGASSPVMTGGGGGRTAAAIGEALRPDPDAPPSMAGVWSSSVGWGANEAESGAGSIRTTHKFSSTLSTGGGKELEAGQYEIEEEARDVP